MGSVSSLGPAGAGVVGAVKACNYSSTTCVASTSSAVTGPCETGYEAARRGIAQWGSWAQTGVSFFRCGTCWFSLVAVRSVIASHGGRRCGVRRHVRYASQACALSAIHLMMDPDPMSEPMPWSQRVIDMARERLQPQQWRPFGTPWKLRLLEGRRQRAAATSRVTTASQPLPSQDRNLYRWRTHIPFTGGIVPPNSHATSAPVGVVQRCSRSTAPQKSANQSGGSIWLKSRT